MDDKPLNESSDEDDIGVSDTGEPSVGTPVDMGANVSSTQHLKAEPVKRGPGRPKGYAKTGGKIRGKIPGQKYSEAEAYAVLGSMVPDIIRFHHEVMQGKTEATFSGPTGKPVVRLPNLPERQKSADWLATNFWRLDEKLEAIAAAAPKPVEPVEADPAAVRKALLEDFMGSLPPSPPPSVVDASDQDSEIISISDPDIIAAHDRGERNGGKAKAKPRLDENNPRPGDRLELPCGFYAISEVDEFGSKRQRWVCYNSAGDRCANKATADAVRTWFWSNTAVGQAEAERIGGRENATPIKDRR